MEEPVKQGVNWHFLLGAKEFTPAAPARISDDGGGTKWGRGCKIMA